jgi:hypothetical protein
VKPFMRLKSLIEWNKIARPAFTSSSMSRVSYNPVSIRSMCLCVIVRLCRSYCRFLAQILSPFKISQSARSAFVESQKGKMSCCPFILQACILCLRVHERNLFSPSSASLTVDKHT